MINRMRQVILAALVVALAGLNVTVQAQWKWRGSQNRDQQVRQLINRIETRTDAFRQSLDQTLDRSRIDGTRAEDNINRLVQDFEDATDRLRDRYDGRGGNNSTPDAKEVLRRAEPIDSFMVRRNVGGTAASQWRSLRADIDELATFYNLRTNWRNNGGYTGGNQGNYDDVQQVINRIEVRTNAFRQSLEQTLDRSQMDNTRAEDNINRLVGEFDEATNRLRDNYNPRQPTNSTEDAREVLRRAVRIDSFLVRRNITGSPANTWRALRADLDGLARRFNLQTNWSTEGGIGGGNTGNYGANRLTGTYRLDRSRSDNARDAANQAARNSTARNDQRAADRLYNRLESPEMLAIERSGRYVTIASSRSPQITFEADGREHTEQTAGGRTVTVRADLEGDKLVVTSAGDRESDFSVTFDPIENGRRLRVTRRISDYVLNQPVVVQSIYDRTSDVAQWSVYNGGYSSPGSGTVSGDFIVPDGTQIVAVLNNDLTTRTSRNNDRFTMRVRDPGQYEGATIEGYVSNLDRGGRITGRSEMTLNFESIRLRNGRTYKFSGLIQSVRALNGETVRVDNEGSVSESSRTSTTATRAAIGTAVGAIIGAIAGGGKGAAIGAVVGAGAGAGSVYVQGRDDLELFSGTEMTIRASAPAYR